MYSHANLTTQYHKAIKKLIKLLELNYNFLDPNASPGAISARVNLKIKEILPDTASFQEQYNAILEWCNDQSKKDSFQLVKKEFINYHDKLFNSRLYARKLCQQELTQKIRAEHEKEWLKQESELKSLNKLFEEKQEKYRQLEVLAQKVIAMQFNANASDEIYQKNVRHLMKLTNEIKKLPAIPKITLIPLASKPTEVDVWQYTQQKILDNLDKNINDYQMELSKRNWWQRFVDWFRPSHHKSVAALVSYSKNVSQCQTNMDMKFKAACQWSSQQKNIDSRTSFFGICLKPFRADIQQAKFESLNVLFEKSQMEVDQLVEVHRNSISSHNQKLMTLQCNFEELYDKSNMLHDALYNVASIKIEEAGVFGYVRNKAQQVVQSIKKLAGIVEKNSNKPVERAKEIVREITQITPVTSPDTIKALAVKAKDVASNPAAALVIQESVHKVIEDTLQYGGKANNYHFMGTTQAGYIVAQLADDKQKAVFKKVQAKSDQNARLSYSEMEENCVSQLERNIETGQIDDQLRVWRDAMLRHNRLEGRSPTVNSERVYTQEIKPAAKEALLMHDKGNKKLESFITRVISAALAASQFDLKGKQMAKGLQTLTWEQSDTLVRVYGTKQQIKNWDGTILPRIFSNSAPPPVAKLSR